MLHGKICHSSIRRTRHAIGGSSNGSGREFSGRIANELVKDLNERGKGTKIMAITDAAGLPVTAHVESALVAL